MVDNGDELEAEQMQMEKPFCPTECNLCGDTLWSWAGCKSIKVIDIKLMTLSQCVCAGLPSWELWPNFITNHAFWMHGLMFSHSNLTALNR